MICCNLLSGIKNKPLRIVVLSFIFGLLLSITPVLAQGKAGASINVDGRQLFKVSQLDGFDAQPRADYANQILNRAVASGNPVAVNVIEVNDLPVIQVNGTNLLTVTEKDTPPGVEKQEQAQQWRSSIQMAINLAQEQRRPEYIRQALFTSVGCLLIAIAINYFLGWMWNNWLFRFLPQPEIGSETAKPTSSVEFFLKLILGLVRGAIWLATALYITNQFTQTRVWSQRIIDGIVYNLASPIIPLGNKSYSVIQLFILIGLFAGLLIFTKTVKNLLRSRILGLTGINRGAQETIVVIANYAMIFIGTIILLQLWGLDLSSVTIFAGVLGVGIGLGLQGIAKEFVSGLVIIFERPIQVGDFINVGEFMGTVERIGVRSTEIRTLDQVAIIVPNSRFLEQEVVNWNHGGLVTRIRLPIGVAYGDDLSKIRSALTDAAKNNRDVLSEPPPKVIFTGFGESSLKLELLVWIREPRKQILIKSDLYFQIDQVFRERNVEIPFPQRDLHLRSSNFPLELSSELENYLKNWLKNNGNGS